LLVVASWWLLHTDAIRGWAGDSIALVGIGIVAVSILRGLGLPLGLWPSHPWRPNPRPIVVILPAAIAAALFILARPTHRADLVALVDPGAYLLVMTGSAGLGFGVTLVAQRGAAPWWGAATAMAAIPYAVGAMFAALGDGATCLGAAGAEAAGNCGLGVIRSTLFLVPLFVTASLVSIELAFRRLLLGHGERVGLLMVLGAASVAALWALAVGRSLLWIGPHWWVIALSSVTAGGLYALSGSLLVSAAFSGITLALHLGFTVSADPNTVPPVIAGGGPVMWAHILVAAAVLAWTFKRCGLVAPFGVGGNGAARD
jgi:hypothetical protein